MAPDYSTTTTTARCPHHGDEWVCDCCTDQTTTIHIVIDSYGKQYDNSDSESSGFSKSDNSRSCFAVSPHRWKPKIIIRLPNEMKSQTYKRPRKNQFTALFAVTIGRRRDFSRN